MKSRQNPFLVLCLVFLFLSCGLVFAEDPVQECRAKVDARIDFMRVELKQLENHYVHYRWAENKMRHLYYEQLWQARRDSIDPFSKTTRAAGRQEEDRLLSLLSNLEKDSSRRSNGFARVLFRIQNSLPDWGKCCPEKSFFDCASRSFQGIDEITLKIRRSFDLVLERERDYRKAVMLTAAGREGLYADDTLEPPARHTEFYWRFEAEREAERFADDKEFQNQLNQIEKILASDFEGRRCCLECGKKA